jgi:hypothetical protein
VNVLRVNRLFGKGALLGASALFVVGLFVLQAHAAEGDVDQRLKLLEQQNATLQEKLQQQQTVIDDLAKKLSTLNSKTEPATPPDEPEKKEALFGQVRISGEGGAGFFHSSENGAHKNSDFRVDEAKLFVEAPLWKNYAYAFVELDLVTRERQTTPPPEDSAFHLGEAYVDFEGVSRLWNRPGMLGVRIGRMDIPFGEEYISRYVIDNPLISHSLTDLWGKDEGLEFYGGIGKFDYVFAVQNGGHPALADFNRDKAIAGRIGWRPRKWLRVSASAMRTGDLDAVNDFMSELWFGNGFLRAIGPGATVFHGDAFEGDVQASWKTGDVKAAGGLIKYGDDAPIASNSSRDIYYYYVEALQRAPGLEKLYGAARFSQIFAERGFPIVGNGDFGDYFFNPGSMTDRMWRISVGGGYRFSEHLTAKVEYTLERRHEISAESENTHLVAAEVGFAF